MAVVSREDEIEIPDAWRFAVHPGNRRNFRRGKRRRQV